MKRSKVKEVIHTIRYDFEDAPLMVSDLPKDLLPTDRIECHSDPGYYAENNSWDPFTEYKVVRFRDQTDEEYQASIKFWEDKKEKSRKTRYEEYLRLKKEFEEGLLTKGKYQMSEQEIKDFEKYSEL